MTNPTNDPQNNGNGGDASAKKPRSPALTVQANDPDRAIAAYKAALEVNPNDRTALNNLALMYRDQARWEDAEATARRATAVDRSWFSYGHLAFALVAQGRYAEADSALPMVTKPKPRDWPLSRSMITCTSVTSPWGVNAERSESLVALKERLPT